MPQSHENLALSGSWSITEDGFKALVDKIEKDLGSLRRIVEFGSGPSTVRLALRFPGAKVESIENHRPSYEATLALTKDYGVDDRVSLRHEELAFGQFGESKILCYGGLRKRQGETIDCVLIDGPSFFTLRGREACLYQIVHRLREGGLVFLDDCRRSDEVRTLANWMRVYPGGFDLEILASGHGIAVLKKRVEVLERWDDPIKRTDGERTERRYARLQEGLEFLDARRLEFLLRGLRVLGVEARELPSLLETMREAYGVVEAPPPDSGSWRASRRAPTSLGGLLGFGELASLMVKAALDR